MADDPMCPTDRERFATLKDEARGATHAPVAMLVDGEPGGLF